MGRKSSLSGAVLKELKAAQTKNEQLHPGRDEEEAFTAFKTQDRSGKEEQLKERSIGPPALCTSSEFALQGLKESAKSEVNNGPQPKADEYDPDRDQREFGICLKMLLCCCFCSC